MTEETSKTEGTITHGLKDVSKCRGPAIPNPEGVYLYDTVITPDEDGAVT